MVLIQKLANLQQSRQNPPQHLHIRKSEHLDRQALVSILKAKILEHVADHHFDQAFVIIVDVAGDGAGEDLDLVEGLAGEDFEEELFELGRFGLLEVEVGEVFVGDVVGGSDFFD